MNPIARRLLVAAVRKLLPDAVPDNPGAALALRPSDREIEMFPPVDRRSLAPQSNSFPTVRPSQIVYAPQPAPQRRRRRIVVVEETTWRS